ncbi:putative P-loop containing nucleoside triphosphate hydrolase protein [Seiridium cardinale]
MAKTMNMNNVAGQEPQISGNLSILTKVDKLRELVGTRVALPQLVVVGDQSSGKSSVLEGLTGFAFPRDVELCTRYVTQITCRRDSEESITVSIIPHQDTEFAEQERLKGFCRSLTNLDPESLAQLFEEANEALAIRTNKKTTSSDGSALPTFSEHILKIEKLGPQEDHFTVIDVPGIFRQEIEGVTSESDIELVMNMVKTYTDKQSSSILAIMPSNVDPATQEILKLAKKADPSMSRTMAVLTKPDLAIEHSVQKIAIDYVTGKRGDLTLGYYIVKNRGPDNVGMSLQQGQVKEKQFFSEHPWSVLRFTRKSGMDALKERVHELLIDLIRKEFPKLKLDIHREWNMARRCVDQMGPSRSTPHAQRAFVNRICERYQSLARNAFTAYYGGDKIFSERHDLRLITQVVKANEVYGHEMRRHGHTRPFAPQDSIQDDQMAKKKPLECSKRIEGPLVVNDNPELEDIIGFAGAPLPEVDDLEDIMDYIEDVYNSSRGQDLGTFNGALLATLFKEQAKKWESITLSHVARVITLVHHFIAETLKHVCAESRVLEELWNGYLLDDLQKSYRRAMEHAKFLLEIELDGVPLTQNHYFNDNLQKDQVDRLASALEILGIQTSCPRSPQNPYNPFAEDGDTRESNIVLSHDLLSNLAINMANSEHVRTYMHDVLKSYYKVAQKRFVDVVCQQAVNHCLLTGKTSPLNVFSTEMVLELNEDELDMIAAEDAPIAMRREKLARDIDSFESALKVLKGSG